MSTANPTPLQVGAAGTYGGRRVRVAGRIVLAMEADGVTYYWNEYHVVDSFGRALTLVYEEGEEGPQWKRFQLFEPLRVLSAGEAAAKRVGDTVNLDGRDVAVTLVDQSRVHHIEGTAPDGVEAGDVANYFNADSGDRLLTVSWTGEEVECYEGRTLPAGEVAMAFGLDRSHAAFGSQPPPLPISAGAGGSPMITRLVGAVLSLAVFFSVFSCGRGHRSSPGGTSRIAAPAPPARQPLPAFRLANGARGTLAQSAFTVTDHAVIEIGRVAGRLDRHEYQLRDGQNESALLINGLSGRAQEWHLFRPLREAPNLANLTPVGAAALRKGTPVTPGSRSLPITELFESRVRSVDGGNGGSLWPGLQYGFIAQQAGETLLARWDEREIRFYRGQVIPATDVLAALGPGPEKSR